MSRESLSPNATILRSFAASALAVALLVAIVFRYRARRSAPTRLALLAACCFAIVAVIHVFEAFGLFVAAGWGKPKSVGHYIDLAAALLGLVFLGTALVAGFVHRTRR